MEKLYYEAFKSRAGGWAWKIYHYDDSGNKEIVVAKSSKTFARKEEAEEDCCEYQEEHGVDAEGL